MAHPACRSSVATTTTWAPSGPASSSYRARTAVREVLPWPRGSIQPARRGRGRRSQVAAIKDRCQGPKAQRLADTMAAGTRMYSLAKRVTASSRPLEPRRGSGEPSAAVLGPAFTG
jgi:hypothetical protein